MVLLKRLGVSLLILLFCLEVLLRVFGVNATFSELTGYGYNSYYGKKDEDGLHTWKPNQMARYNEPEFQIDFMINELGLRETPVEVNKSDSVFRIITLGDSFTEGAGVNYEHAYPRFLENMLNLQSDSVEYEVINAGVSGSDLFYMNALFERKLIDYNPDAVIYLLNNSDVLDVMFRGGEERFQDDGSAISRPGPWFKHLYRFSFTFRFIAKSFLGINESLLTEPNDLKERQIAVDKLSDEVARTYTIFENYENIKLKIVIHPPPLLLPNHSDYSSFLKFDQNSENIKKQLEIEYQIIHFDGVLNLFPESFKRYKSMEYDQYAWPLNAHFNELGYEILADLIYDAILLEDSAFFQPQP